MIIDQRKTCDAEVATVTQGAALSFIGKIAGSVLQYVYTIMITRFLGITSFGVLVLGLTIVNLAGTIARLGLDIGVIRFVSQYHGAKDYPKIKGVIIVALKYSFVLSLAMAGLLYFAVENLSIEIIKKDGLNSIVPILILSIPFTSIMVISLAVTKAFKTMKYDVFGQNIFMPICNIVFAVVFYLLGFDIRGIASAYVISVVLSSIVSLYFLGRSFPRMNLIKAQSETSLLLGFSIPLTLVVLLHFLIMWTDTLMLGYFRSPEEVGIYNVAMKTALVINTILFSCNAIFAPVMSDLYNNGKFDKVNHLFSITTKWIFIASLPAFLLILLLSQEIMLVFGKEAVVGYMPLIILAFAQFVNCSVGPVGVMLAMSGHQRLVMYITLGVCMLNLIMNYMLIPTLGMIGAAVASGTSVIVMSLVMLFWVLSFLKTIPYNRKYLKPAFIALLSFLVILLVKQLLSGWGYIHRIYTVALLYGGLYCFLVYVSSVDAEDLYILESFKEKAALLCGLRKGGIK